MTPLLVMALMQLLNWRMILVLFGTIGVVWAIVWHRWFRDDPAQHPSVNAAELEYILAGREADAAHGAGRDYWRRLATHRNTFALCLMYFPNSYAFYFCITWLPTYLKEKHGLTNISLGVCAGLPMAFSVLGDLFGGVATDWAVARWGLRVGRSGLGCAAYLVAGTAAILAVLSPQPLAAAGLISLAVAASMFTLGAAWGTCLDIGGNHAGVVSAAMNTSGQIGSMISPVLAITLVKTFGDWNAPLCLIGVLFFAGALCWCFVDPRRRIFGSDAK